jgi:hypothetical protein
MPACRRRPTVDAPIDEEGQMKIYKAMGGIGLLAAVLLAVSYPFRDDEHGVRWILGGIGWFGFLLCLVALIVLALVALGRGAFRRMSSV